MEEESTLMRDQPMRSAASSLARSISRNRSQTPACCHSRSRRQQLMPEPQPISCGSISQGIPDCGTNGMPVSTARSPNGLRPGHRDRRGFGGGGNSWISAHNSSSSIGLAMSSWRNDSLSSRHFLALPPLSRHNQSDGNFSRAVWLRTVESVCRTALDGCELASIGRTRCLRTSATRSQCDHY
jgi:hypothetical protein